MSGASKSGAAGGARGRAAVHGERALLLTLSGCTARTARKKARLSWPGLGAMGSRRNAPPPSSCSVCSISITPLPLAHCATAASARAPASPVAAAAAACAPAAALRWLASRSVCFARNVSA